MTQYDRTVHDNANHVVMTVHACTYKKDSCGEMHTECVCILRKELEASRQSGNGIQEAAQSAMVGHACHLNI